LYDTVEISCLKIPEDKTSKTLALISFLERRDYNRLTRLTLSMVVGVLQSLVPATPGNIGGSFLQGLYMDLFSLKDPELVGTKGYYFTSVDLSPSGQSDLCWWRDTLKSGLSRQYQNADMACLAVNWGDGSGNRCGGTFNWVNCDDEVGTLHTWLGVWKSTVHHFSSNWRELRTIKDSLQLLVVLGTDVQARQLPQITWSVMISARRYIALQ